MEKENKLYQETTDLKKQLDFSGEKQQQKSILGRFQIGLKKTKEIFVDDLREVLLGDEELDELLFDEIEELLLTADFGVPTSRRILNHLQMLYSKGVLKNKKQTFQKLQELVSNILLQASQDFFSLTAKNKAILFVGVNGVGKTTTIGKIAYQLQEKGQKILLAAGDTYRAAAIEQLKIWSERAEVELVAKETGADSAATIFEATEKTLAENYDCLLCDTSGRLHNNKNLMYELVKIKKVLQKLVPEKHKTILILDANTGQNAVSQVKIFQEMINIDGLIVTKLDGSAKGGVVIGLINEFELPLYFLGVGEKKEDLQAFHPQAFAEALFS